LPFLANRFQACISVAARAVRDLASVFQIPKGTDDFLLESYDVGLPEQTEQHCSHQNQ
jgi:hypothetical protein